MIYLDSTALIKLIRADPLTPALTAYLQPRAEGTTLFSCAITRAELVRTAAHLHPDAIEHAQHLLSGLDLVAVTDRLLDAAIALDPAPPRIVDALHLAAALTAGPQLRTVLTYDTDLTAAAAALNIPTTCPGGAP